MFPPKCMQDLQVILQQYNSKYEQAGAELGQTQVGPIGLLEMKMKFIFT